MSKIMVPVDGSDSSVSAARFASEQASAQGGTVTLLHVYALHSSEAMGLVAVSREQMEQMGKDASRHSFARAEEVMTHPPAAKEITFGDPAQEILSMAKKLGVDQIVMGSRGLSPMRELLLGSVSHKVVTHVSCPVTVVR